MDKLEEFIKQNRDKLDRYEPTSGSWEKISGKRIRGRKSPSLIYFAAAAIIILAGLALFLRLQQSGSIKKPDIAVSAQQELSESERFYSSLYHNLYDEARPLLTGQPDVMKEIDKGNAHIDSICSDMKKDLKDNISNKEVIEALIRNYRIRIQLLEEMLDMVKKNDADKKADSHEL